MRATLAIVILAVTLLAACSRPASVFVERNARAHINVLAGTIGSRPAGTQANQQARAYIVDQLTLYGFAVRVQETDARRAEIGRTARVANIIAILPGERPEAVGLLTHYDSGFDNPGAADAAFGVGVALEAARSLAARERRRWSLFVLVTDAEEAGLMGAAGLTTDREVTDRLKAYVNLEAAGSTEPVPLFETGPGHSWLVSAWARHAPWPRGGSYALEVYRRLPNDTDFSILKHLGIPGLNFASIGNGYVYHTARDVPDGVTPRTVQRTGENVVSIVGALDGVDVTQRDATDAIYFDVGGVSAVSLGARATWVMAAAALLAGTFAFVRVAVGVARLIGVWRLLLAAVWSGAGLLLTVAAMAGAAWALRAAREAYHPWYARPDRLLVLLAVTGFAAAWAIARIGAWLPWRGAERHPAIVWALTLPLWLALALGALWTAPAAAYLWTIPLLAAGLLLSITPPGHDGLIRIVSVVVLGVAATLWLRETIDLFRFIVAVFGRLPLVTPAFVYAAVLAAGGVMIVPPLIAIVARTRPLLHPALVTALGLAAVATAAGFAYAAPAYTVEQPLRRSVRAIQEDGGATAVWDVASTEPGLDLEAGAPGGWRRDASAPPSSVPVPRLAHPWVFRTDGPALGPAPARITAATATPLERGVELTITVVPAEPGIAVTFVAPPGAVPARSNLPGVVRLDRWRATYVAPPRDGIAWQASFADGGAATLAATRVLVVSGRLPGGDGWQSLPRWLPQDRTVWNASATWILAPPAAVAPLAPGPALR